MLLDAEHRSSFGGFGYCRRSLHVTVLSGFLQVNEMKTFSVGVV